MKNEQIIPEDVEFAEELMPLWKHNGTVIAQQVANYRAKVVREANVQDENPDAELIDKIKQVVNKFSVSYEAFSVSRIEEIIKLVRDDTKHDTGSVSDLNHQIHRLIMRIDAKEACIDVLMKAKKELVSGLRWSQLLMEKNHFHACNESALVLLKKYGRGLSNE